MIKNNSDIIDYENTSKEEYFAYYYFRKNNQKIPLLSKVFKNYFCISSSSAD